MSCKRGEEAFSERFYFVEKKQNVFKTKYLGGGQTPVENERRDCLLPCVQIMNNVG